MKTGIEAALIALVLACASAWSQDPGMMAAQQAMQASQQATQQALQSMQTAQQINQQFTQAVLQANSLSQWNSSGWNPALLGGTRVLSLSVGPGNVKPGTKLRIQLSPHRDAQIYYTTDGWMPTTT